MTDAEKDLFLSIWALDSYNQGYDAKTPNLSDDVNVGIGDATISRRISDVSATFASEAEAAGFYAVAYTIGDEIIISYRGAVNIGQELASVSLQPADNFW